MKSVVRAWLGVLVLVLAAAPVWAQTTAQINGTVVDSDGGVLPGATVAVTQTETGFKRDTVSEADGAFALTNLPLGPYRLEVMLSGFREYVQTGIVLQVGSNPVIKVTMQLGQLAETVQVVGEAPLVETRNPAVGQVIEKERIEALPLNGRNPAELITLGGAATDSGQTSSRTMTSSKAISIAGGQAFGVAYLLDGAVHNNAFDGLNMPLPFPDALQEFKVETSSQNAQNGTHAGGTVSLVTKSGTNQFHGDAFEFFRNHKFNATSPFAGVDPKTGKERHSPVTKEEEKAVQVLARLRELQGLREHNETLREMQKKGVDGELERHLAAARSVYGTAVVDAPPIMQAHLDAQAAQYVKGIRERISRAPEGESRDALIAERDALEWRVNPLHCHIGGLAWAFDGFGLGVLAPFGCCARSLLQSHAEPRLAPRVGSKIVVAWTSMVGLRFLWPHWDWRVFGFSAHSLCRRAAPISFDDWMVTCCVGGFAIARCSLARK